MTGGTKMTITQSGDLFILFSASGRRIAWSKDRARVERVRSLLGGASVEETGSFPAYAVRDRGEIVFRGSLVECRSMVAAKAVA
jgi:hypothetical protein